LPLTHRYGLYMTSRKPTLVVMPIPIEGNSTVYDYVFDKEVLG